MNKLMIIYLVFCPLAFVSIVIQAQGVEGAMGRDERLPVALTNATAAAAAAASTTTKYCDSDCKCCSEADPDKCVSTCCMAKTCSEPGDCVSTLLQCGCDNCTD